MQYTNMMFMSGYGITTNSRKKIYRIKTNPEDNANRGYIEGGFLNVIRKQC